MKTTKKADLISVRVEPELKERIESAAKEVGIKAPELVRRLLSIVTRHDITELKTIVDKNREVTTQAGVWAESLEKAQVLVKEQEQMYAHLKQRYIDLKGQNLATEILYDKEQVKKEAMHVLQEKMRVEKATHKTART